MNSNTGRIYDFEYEEELEKLQDAVGAAFVKINKEDMTEKQKKEMQVSKYDTRSKLGRFRQQIIQKIGRNSLCTCGSGKKYKKCCLYSK